MAKFEIGEIAIYAPHSITNIRGKCGPGSECEIISNPQPPEMYSDQTNEPWYWCVFEDDPSPKNLNAPRGAWAVRQSELRKKKPPQEASTWETLEKATNGLWNPMRVTV